MALDPGAEQAPGRDAFIIRPADPTRPLDPATCFDAGKPLEVDVGCGKGRFLVARAAENPDVNFLGIDRLLVRLRKASKKVGRLGLCNVRLLRLEAAYAVRYLLPTAGVRVFYVFFPDPWPKRKHQRRRLFTKAFLDDICRCLVPGGRLHVATDHLSYFRQIRDLVVDDPRFFEIDTFAPPPSQQTDFELGFVEMGATIGRASFCKREPVDAAASGRREP